MAMDGLVVSFGLSEVVVKLRWVGSTLSDAVFGVLSAFVIALASYSLYRLPGSRKLVDSQRPVPPVREDSRFPNAPPIPPSAHDGGASTPVIGASSPGASGLEGTGEPLAGSTLRRTPLDHE
jgi:hypothetical protein